jgi:hypothetical protein
VYNGPIRAHGTCSTITGLGGGSGPSNCPPSTGQPPQQQALAGGRQNQTTSKPGPSSPGAVTPNFENAILAPADAVMDRPDDDALRARLQARLERTLADHSVPMKPQDYACLEPVSDASPKLIDVPLRWRPQDIKKEAIDRSHLCDDAAAGDAKDACREEKYGQAVMWAEPELAGQCSPVGGPAQDIDAVANYAKTKFLNAWTNGDGIAKAPPPDTWSMPADCSASAPPATRKQSLRDRLRAALDSAMSTDQASSGDSGEVRQPAPDATTAENAPAPPPPSPADDNEADCNYIVREAARGELTVGGGNPIPPECKGAIAAAEALRKQQQAIGVPPFSMSDIETDQEIKRLLGEQATTQNQPK